jgi:hypothetical protein
VSRCLVHVYEFCLIDALVETVYPRKKEPPKAYLDSIVGDTQRQVENKQAEDIVAAGSVEQDLRKALEVSISWGLGFLLV